MGNSSENRNILFGIVAVENEFVSADQMHEVFRRWVLEKSQPVAELFKELEGLNDDQCQLIHSIVDQRMYALD